MNSIDRSQITNEPDPTADLARSNPPALSTLTYRGGKYRPTRERMLSSLSSQDALARLNQDADNDWSIALLHAWSIVTDVLGFYQERITNEGYIRTASERRSVLALARALGYDWRPGLAANVDLVLTVGLDDQDQPQSIQVEKGRAVQSTPAEEKQPQIFETSTKAEVRTEWNLLYPYVGLKATEAGESEPLLTNITSMRVANYRSDLKKDDLILLVDQSEPEQKTEATQPAWVLGTLTEVVADPQKPYTIIRWTVEDSAGTEIKQPALFVFRQKAALFDYAKGAVYYDGEAIPPAPKAEGTTTDSKTNGKEMPGEITTGKATTITGKPSPTTIQPATSITQIQSDSGPATGDVTTGGSGQNGTANGTKTENKINGADNPPADEPPPSPKVANWTPRTLSLPNLDINAFIVNAKGMIFAGSKRDLFRSLDNGESWQAVGVDPVGRNVTALTLDAKDNLFAGSSTGGIYLSYDNGDNWTPVSGDSVAPDVKVTKESNGETFKVDPPEILPKSPILELEFGINRAGKAVLYALASEKLFASENDGKTWKAIEPGDELPATQKRLNAAEQRQLMTNAAKGLFAAARLQWLQQIVTLLAQGAGSANWLRLDLWTFLVSMVRTPPAGATATRALAVSTQGKKSTVVVGTDAGKFTLKEKTRRWLVASVIVVLVLFQQFLLHRDDFGSTVLEIDTIGVMDVMPALATGKVITATTALFSQGTLHFADHVTTVATETYTLTLTGSDNLPASVDEKGEMLLAMGNIPLNGLFTDTVGSAVAISAFTTLTATIAPGMENTDTLFAITTTEAVIVNLKLTVTASVSQEQAIWPPVITPIKVEITGTIAPASALPEDVRFPWLNSIWQQASELLQSTFIASWGAIKGFLTELWAALPSWIHYLLLPLYELIQSIILFVDTYLIKPLLNYTAATLLDISAITLGVLALLLTWIYADHKMSNRKSVRLSSPVNALAIHSNGQIFAGTKEGVFRSLADDPNASWWSKATRALIRRAFPDVPMEPINYGWTTIDPDSQKELTPDIRSLSFTNRGALLAGTSDGRIYRLSDPTAELDPELITDPNTNPESGAKPNPNAKPNAKPTPLVKWVRYDQGIVEETQDNFRSALKSVRTIAITPLGQFVAGGAGTDKVEDRWFTTQIRQDPTIDDQNVNQHINRCEIDLDKVYPDLKKDDWLVLRPRTTATSEQMVAKSKYAHFQISKVERVQSQDFVTVGEFTRAIVCEDEQLVPAEKRLSTFLRTQTEVLIQSDKIDLFDNRPVEGKWLYLKGHIPALTEGHRLIVNGKQKLVLITETMQDALRSDNNLEWYPLEKGDVVHAVSIPEQETLASISETMENALCSDTSLERRTLNKGDILQIVTIPNQVMTDKTAIAASPDAETDASEPAPLLRWRLRTPDGFVGTVDATTEQIRSVAGLRWWLRMANGFVGRVDATKEQIRWTLPSESEPEVSEVARVLRSETINLAEEIDIQAEIDYAYDRVTITKVQLQNALEHVYDRATVTVFGNVVPATHGQTVKEEVLGSGSGMQANERFMLKERPLTYVISAVNERGYEGEIKVKVNGIEWQKELSLYGLKRDRRAYIVRQDALDNTYITFGDGKQGARLPTGTEQVTATYRIGSGPNGNVLAYTIDQPQTFPSAVRRVTNPLPASGGMDPDSIEDVRKRTPIDVRIMDRIVALSDYEDYVRLYAGIGRVQLKRFGVGPNLLLHFTVADGNGEQIETGSPLLAALRKSIDERRAMAIPRIQIESYEQLYFDLDAKLLIFPEHKGRVREIEQEIRQKLQKAFSFAEREFGRDVAESEVVALMQTVTGVAVVESVHLKRSKTSEAIDDETPNERLVAELARIKDGKLRPAQLLLLNPTSKGTMLEIATTDDPTRVLNEREVFA